MRIRLFPLLCFATTGVTSWSFESALACTIGENMQTHLPFGATDISNADRLAIANMYIEAKKWPDIEIRGIVYVGGYVKERPAEPFR